MNRRDAMTAVSGAVAGSALLALGGRAFAQTATPGTTGSAQIAAPAVTPSTAKPLDAAAYRQQTLKAGTFAKQSSVLALTQAQHPKVRQFAKFESDEQTAVAQTLTDNPAAPPVPLDAEHQQKLASLSASNGKAFDQAYVTAQIEGHNQLLAIQKSFLARQSSNRDLDHIAVLARAVITMHLAMLQDLQAELSA